MDPYLEEPSLWPDFHATMLVAIRAALQATLPATFATFVVGGATDTRPRRLHLRHSPSWQTFTVIHLLRPLDKETGPVRNAYLGDRSAALNAGKNWVDLDLLRAGERALASDQPGGYRIVTATGIRRDNPSVLSFGLRDPLPRIMIPLLPANGVAFLDLQRCLDRAYDEAPHAADVDYSQPPIPRLSDEDAAWARQLLAARTTHQGASS
jgi:hypothetical protein